MAAPMPPADAFAQVVIDYTNWRGERALRTIEPRQLVWSEGNEFHPRPQWLLEAWDVEKGALRSFAMVDIHSWTPKNP